MPKARLKMRQIKEILRLKYALQLSHKKIASSTGIAKSTVKDYLLRAKAAGYTWPLPDGVENDQLEAHLFPSTSSRTERPKPDFNLIHQELKRKGVTLCVLWEEYKRTHPDGYQYSWFAERYREWARARDVWMVQPHKAGEKTYVDYSGLTVPIWRSNLKKIEFCAEIFVSVLGASDYIFCLATKTQKLPDWIEAHNKMFEFYGGVSELIVPDNLRSAVTQSHRYEPQTNITYEEMAQHYGCAIMPARSYRPRDKAKVEKAVQFVQQRILSVLRSQKFTSIESLNLAISYQLTLLNKRKFQKMDCTRQQLFESVEKPSLRPLPARAYETARWQKQTVNGGYHILIDQHHYSVPHQYVRKKIDIRITAKTVECFYHEKKIACHERNYKKSLYTTVNQHRPEPHRQQALWTSKRLQAWADSVGPKTSLLIEKILKDPKRHLHKKERSAVGILRLSTAYGEGRVENACSKALDIGTHRYDSILSLLKRRLESAESFTDKDDPTYHTPQHDNVRGQHYYH